MFLKTNRITAIFNCTKDLPFCTEAGAKMYRLPVDDNLEMSEIRNMTLWSYEAVHKVMKEYKTGNHILIHCAAGMQRSAACVALFLIATRNMRPDQAIQYIQERRPVAFRPSVNFGPAIEGFYIAYQRDIAKASI